MLLEEMGGLCLPAAKGEVQMDYDKDEQNSGDITEAGTAAGTETIPVPETEIPPALETYGIGEHTEPDNVGTGEGQGDMIEEIGTQGYNPTAAPAPGPQGNNTAAAPAPGPQGNNPAAAPAPGPQGYNPAAAPPTYPQGYTTAPAPGQQGYYNQNSTPQNNGYPQNYPIAPPPQNTYRPAGEYQYPPEPEKNGMAIASLVMGILSLLCCCCGYAGVGFGALGIIFALLSRKEEPMCSQAKTGLILSCIGLAMTVIVVIFFIFAEAASLFIGGIN